MKKMVTIAILGFWVVFLSMFSGLRTTSSASIPIIYPANPMPAHTGGFGEKSCHSCHSDFDLNPSGGALEVRMTQTTVQPGKEHVLKLSLTHPEMVRAGFQLTARFADGPETGKQAGRFIPSVTHHTMTEQAGISYLSQTMEGGIVTKPGWMEWSANWVAPAGKHKVVFHVSAVAGDKDGSQYGDWVYVTEFSTRGAN